MGLPCLRGGVAVSLPRSRLGGGMLAGSSAGLAGLSCGHAALSDSHADSQT